jgi:hypothetical protein
MFRLEGIQNAVKYLEMSTWRASQRYGGNKESVARDCNLAPGGWPIRVRGVEGIVAVLVVHGLGLKLKKDGSVEITTIEESGSRCSSVSRVHTASLDHELILNALKVVLNKQ